MIDPSIRAELLRLETALASRDARGIDGGLSSLIADGFLEFGASGAVWAAHATHRLVDAEPPIHVAIEDFRATVLAPGVV